MMSDGFPAPQTELCSMPAAYYPTPEEIRLACQKIQHGWSPEERQSRRLNGGQSRILRCHYLLIQKPVARVSAKRSASHCEHSSYEQ